MSIRTNILCAAVAALLLPIGPSAARAQGLEPVVTDTAEITTSMGKITLVLYGKDAPQTVANFVGLVKKGFYRGILFHRIAPGFVIQAGDPNTKDSTRKADWGRGGESIYGKEFADELNPNTPSYKRGYLQGTLAMANRGPNTNTSQWFITLKDVVLTMNYTIFGRVVSGMDVVHAIEALPIADRTTGRPVSPPKIVDIVVKHVKGR